MGNINSRSTFYWHKSAHIHTGVITIEEKACVMRANLVYAREQIVHVNRIIQSVTGNHEVDGERVVGVARGLAVTNIHTLPKSRIR